MRVINHFLRKKVKRDDDGYVYDPGEVQAAEKNLNREHKSTCFMDFLEDRHKDDVYDDISQFISGRA